MLNEMNDITLLTHLRCMHGNTTKMHRNHLNDVVVGYYRMGVILEVADDDSKDIFGYKQVVKFSCRLIHLVP